MDAAVKLPARRRINVRILVFIGLVVLLVGMPVYLFVRATITRGIRDLGDLKAVDLKAMGNFEIDEAAATLEDVPAVYRKLDGQRLMLEGYMFCRVGSIETTEFELVYNIQKCCFNGPPKVQERVYCHSGTKPVPLYGEMVRVVGKLHIKINRSPQGTITSIYDLDVESVEPM